MFRSVVARWVEDCYQPVGYYSKRIGECTTAILARSRELTALQNSRTFRGNAAVHYLLRVLGIVLQQVLPPAAALGGGWVAFWGLQQNAAIAAAAAAAAETDTSAAAAGTWTGDMLHTVLTSTYQFGTTLLDHTFALKENSWLLQQTVLQTVVPLLSAVCCYWGAWFLVGFLQNLFILVSKEQLLLHMQQTFLQESRALVERGLTQSLRPRLLRAFHSLLSDCAAAANSSAAAQRIDHLIHTYSLNYVLLRHSIYDELFEDIKGLELSQLMAGNRATSEYFQGLFYLMRNTELDVAQSLFDFYQEITGVDGDPLTRFVDKGWRRLRTLLRSNNFSPL
jgi:hypothetical protein